MSHLISPSLRESTDKVVEKVRKVLDGLRTGRVADDLFSARGRSYFDDAVLKDYRQSLRTLGELLLLTPLEGEHRGGMTRHVYRAEFETASVTIMAFVTANGTFEQFMIFRN